MPPSEYRDPLRHGIHDHEVPLSPHPRVHREIRRLVFHSVLVIPEVEWQRRVRTGAHELTRHSCVLDVTTFGVKYLYLHPKTLSLDFCGGLLVNRVWPTSYTDLPPAYRGLEATPVTTVPLMKTGCKLQANSSYSQVEHMSVPPEPFKR